MHVYSKLSHIVFNRAYSKESEDRIAVVRIKQTSTEVIPRMCTLVLEGSPECPCSLVFPVLPDVTILDLTRSQHLLNKHKQF